MDRDSFVANETKVYNKSKGEATFLYFKTTDLGEYIYVQFKGHDEATRYAFPSCFDDDFLSFDKFKDIEEFDEFIKTDAGKKELEKEQAFYKSITERIELDYKKSKKNSDINNIKIYDKAFIGNGSLNSSETVLDTVPNIEQIHTEPYFAKIDYSDNHNLVIGKHSYKNEIVEWTDPLASLYYQYQFFINNPEYGLNLVRHFSTYEGFKYFNDLYNNQLALEKDNNDGVKITDQHLLKIINSHKANKRIHDIITSIQEEQYQIISRSNTMNIVVEGCAGSGKTMILLHRLKYLIHNMPELLDKNIIIVAPTIYLKNELEELGQLLDVKGVSYYSSQSLYQHISKTIARNNNSYWPNEEVIGISPNSALKDSVLSKLYSADLLDNYLEVINKLVTDHKYMDAFVDEEERRLYEDISMLLHLDNIDSVTFSMRKYLKEGSKLCVPALDAMKQISMENVEATCERVKNDYEEKRFSEETFYKRNKTLSFVRSYAKYLSKQTKYIKATSSNNISVVADNYPTLFSDIEKLYEHYESRSEAGVKTDNPIEIFIAYRDLQARNDRLKNFEHVKDVKVFAYDIIQHYIREQKRSIGMDIKKNYEWELFWSAYYMSRLCNDKIIEDGMMLFDEFQDFSYTEFKMLNQLIPKATVNLFGDFDQSITAKGITRDEFGILFGNYEHFSIDVNYRNAMEITQYVNSKFEMNMFPVGIDGDVKSITFNEFRDIEFESDDRVALIVKDLDYVDESLLDDDISNLISKIDEEIERGKINIIPVSLVKGLEFEVVGVVPKKMDKNEAYVAMTRALNSLYIVGSNRTNAK